MTPDDAVRRLRINRAGTPPGFIYEGDELIRGMAFVADQGAVADAFLAIYPDGPRPEPVRSPSGRATRHYRTCEDKHLAAQWHLYDTFLTSMAALKRGAV